MDRPVQTIPLGLQIHIPVWPTLVLPGIATLATLVVWMPDLLCNLRIARSTRSFKREPNVEPLHLLAFVLVGAPVSGIRVTKETASLVDHALGLSTEPRVQMARIEKDNGLRRGCLGVRMWMVARQWWADILGRPSQATSSRTHNKISFAPSSMRLLEITHRPR